MQTEPDQAAKPFDVSLLLQLLAGHAITSALVIGGVMLLDPGSYNGGPRCNRTMIFQPRVPLVCGAIYAFHVGERPDRTMNIVFSAIATGINWASAAIVFYANPDLGGVFGYLCLPACHRRRGARDLDRILVTDDGDVSLHIRHQFLEACKHRK